MARTISSTVFFLVLVGMCPFITPASACVILRVVDISPETLLKTATAVHLGKVRTVNRDDTQPKQVIVVTVSETLLGKSLSELTVEVLFIPSCGWTDIFETGDSLIVAQSSDHGKDIFLPYHYSSAAYVDKLRTHIRESQSNRAVQPTR